MANTNSSAVFFLGTRAHYQTDQPRVWFIRAEAVLGPQKIADEAQFQIVVSKLDTKTDWRNGDRRPKTVATSSPYARSRTGEIPDDTLRILWQSHLTTSVRAVLAVSETKDMDNLATVADKIMEASQQPQISEFSSPQPIRRNSQQVLDPETYDSGNTSTETLCQNDEQLWKDQENESPNCNQSGWCYGSDINVNFDTGVKKRLNRHDEAVSDIKPALLNMSQESDLEKDKPRRKFLSFLSSLTWRKRRSNVQYLQHLENVLTTCTYRESCRCLDCQVS
ncbi:unnamed protein product [Pieris macdunnoughi]|uniref:DUF4802 domain-containing protein n=1 Tax=Pieris macdunnoughi TaxID=345717 RepID=A0A821KQC0_9NEOP|nr:unnamed protein product [Pieris macdunnoughi]